MTVSTIGGGAGGHLTTPRTTTPSRPRSGGVRAAHRPGPQPSAVPWVARLATLVRRFPPFGPRGCGGCGRDRSRGVALCRASAPPVPVPMVAGWSAAVVYGSQAGARQRLDPAWGRPVCPASPRAGHGGRLARVRKSCRASPVGHAAALYGAARASPGRSPRRSFPRRAGKPGSLPGASGRYPERLRGAGRPPGLRHCAPRGTFPAIRLGRALPNGRRPSWDGVPFRPRAALACRVSAVPFPGRCR